VEAVQHPAGFRRHLEPAGLTRTGPASPVGHALLVSWFTRALVHVKRRGTKLDILEPIPITTPEGEAAVEDGLKPWVDRRGERRVAEAKKQIRLLEQENEVLRRAVAYLSQANLPGTGVWNNRSPMPS
jgi:hypothetical protein